MNAPEWIKPGIYGAGIGAVFVGVVGFTWGGRVTGGTANDRAMAMSATDGNMLLPLRPCKRCRPDDR